MLLKIFANALLCGIISPKSCHDFGRGIITSSSRSLLKKHGSPLSTITLAVTRNEIDGISPNSVTQQYTHLIAIPMEECRDICVALESVQRAITHFCPSLLDACISPTMTRLPLLYVDASSSQKQYPNETLYNIVQDTVANSKGNSVPFMMKFKGLEIDGRKNEVLYCVGKSDDEGATTKRLQNIVGTLRTKIEAMGYKTMLPPDMPQIKSSFNQHVNDNKPHQWRPRIPFMRLPLKLLEEGSSDDNEEFVWRTPEDGGNGISPILWYKWWNDEFTEKEGDGERLREVAIYSRIPSSTTSIDLSEESFPLMNFKTPLPVGSNGIEDLAGAPSLSAKLQRSEEYDQIILLSKPDDLAYDYNISTDILDIEYTNYRVYEEGNKRNTEPTARQEDNFTRTSTSLEDSSRNNDANGDDTRSAEAKMKKPWPKEPLINKYHKIQGLKAETIKAATQKFPMPPYPSKEYFVGAWRMVSFPIDSNYANPDSVADMTNSIHSDNLILRVDGAVAGGPLLDSRTKQKSAGGSWKMFEAEYIGRRENQDNSTIIKTRMRIVLLIPPQKTEELVMEGEVTRIAMPAIDLLGSVTEHPQRDSLLHCGGEAWVQEISTGRRKKLGQFSVVKLSPNDPEQLHFSVPPPRRGLE